MIQRRGRTAHIRSPPVKLKRDSNSRILEASNMHDAMERERNAVKADNEVLRASLASKGIGCVMM